MKVFLANLFDTYRICKSVGAANVVYLFFPANTDIFIYLLFNSVLYYVLYVFLYESNMYYACANNNSLVLFIAVF